MARIDRAEPDDPEYRLGHSIGPSDPYPLPGDCVVFRRPDGSEAYGPRRPARIDRRHGAALSAVDLVRGRRHGDHGRHPDHRRTAAIAPQHRVPNQNGASARRPDGDLLLSADGPEQRPVLGSVARTSNLGATDGRGFDVPLVRHCRLRPADRLHDPGSLTTLASLRRVCARNVRMSVATIAKWIETTALGTAISQSAWMFPAIETIHVIAIALVVGTIAILDLRLLGVSWSGRAVTEVSKEILPWTWSAFIVAVISGLLMFVSAARKYVADLPLQLQMVLLVLAGVN